MTSHSSSGVNRNEINYNQKPKYVLTSAEKTFAYNQIAYRKTYFENEIVRAANIKDIKRVRECTNALDMIESILSKLLGDL
jgi:hypothetical protein